MVSTVAKSIENALGKTVPILIGFLASLLGIGGLADKVLGVIRKIRHGYRYENHSNPGHSGGYQMDHGLADSGWGICKRGNGNY